MFDTDIESAPIIAFHSTTYTYEDTIDNAQSRTFIEISESDHDVHEMLLIYLGGNCLASSVSDILPATFKYCLSVVP